MDVTYTHQNSEICDMIPKLQSCMRLGAKIIVFIITHKSIFQFFVIAYTLPAQPVLPLEYYITAFRLGDLGPLHCEQVVCMLCVLGDESYSFTNCHFNGFEVFGCCTQPGIWLTTTGSFVWFPYLHRCFKLNGDTSVHSGSHIR